MIFCHLSAQLLTSSIPSGLLLYSRNNETVPDWSLDFFILIGLDFVCFFLILRLGNVFSFYNLCRVMNKCMGNKRYRSLAQKPRKTGVILLMDLHLWFLLYKKRYPLPIHDHDPIRSSKWWWNCGFWRFLSEHMIHLVIYGYGYIPHYKVELVSSLFIFNRAAISKDNLMAYQYRAL